MRATCWEGKKKVRVEQVPDPKILNSRDAIVRITSTAICGSDLHLYNGFVPTMKRGDVLGHEFMGEVVEVGRNVKNLAVGDRVVVPFPIACPKCFLRHAPLEVGLRSGVARRRVLRKGKTCQISGTFAVGKTFSGVQRFPDWLIPAR